MQAFLHSLSQFGTAVVATVWVFAFCVDFECELFMVLYNSYLGGCYQDVFLNVRLSVRGQIPLKSHFMKILLRQPRSHLHILCIMRPNCFFVISCHCFAKFSLFYLIMIHSRKCSLEMSACFVALLVMNQYVKEIIHLVVCNIIDGIYHYHWLAKITTVLC